ncbi:Radial spoke head 14 [Borealophlyctis nickersoniae]|nr:Radial spoke head 14 [Borealophlyctis nickersoniae]
MGLFLDVVKSEADKALGDAWSRPLVFFRLSVLKKNTRETVAHKEREPAGQEGFGNGFSHPRSWGWAAMLPLARLGEALTADGTLVVHAEVCWQNRAELVGLLNIAAKSCPSSGGLLFSERLSDVRFRVMERTPEESSMAGEPMDDGGDEISGRSPSESSGAEDEDDSNSGEESLGRSAEPGRANGREEGKMRTLSMGKMVSIPAHRAILASRSDYFSTMFSSGLREGQSQDSIVDIPDFSASAVRAMLEYLYTGRLATSPADRPSRAELIRLADRYQLSGLHNYIGAMMMEKDLSLDSAVDLLELADIYSSASGELKAACLGFVKENISKLKIREPFREWVRGTDRRDLLVELFALM